MVSVLSFLLARLSDGIYDIRGLIVLAAVKSSVEALCRLLLRILTRPLHFRTDS